MLARLAQFWSESDPTTPDSKQKLSDFSSGQTFDLSNKVGLRLCQARA